MYIDIYVHVHTSCTYTCMIHVCMCIRTHTFYMSICPFRNTSWGFTARVHERTNVLHSWGTGPAQTRNMCSVPRSKTSV